MGPRQEDDPKTPRPQKEARPRRFRLVKLEERIAPSAGGNKTNNSACVFLCNYTDHHCGVF
jgi:hypothetical protein